MLKISIIIPTYNRMNFLRDAVVSVLNQSYGNFEIIIVDDCSQDGTTSVVESIKDERIIYIKHSENRGVAASCNTGINKSTGNFVFILNDDDLITQDALGKLVDKIIHSGVENLGGVYGWSWWVDGRGNTLRVIDSQERGNILEKIIKKQNFTNLLVKREVFNVIGLYEESLRNNEDFDFYLRMAKKYQFDFVPEIITVVRGHNQSHLSSFSKVNINLHDKVIEKFHGKPVNAKRLLFEIVPSGLYVRLSKLKNYILYFIKRKKFSKRIEEIRENFKAQGINI